MQKDKSGKFEWTATVININRNHNISLFNSCKSLYHYSEYVNKVKESLNKGLPKNVGVDKALSFAINQNFFNGYLKKLKMEVLNMSLTEFNEEEFVRHRREEGRKHT